MYRLYRLRGGVSAAPCGKSIGNLFFFLISGACLFVCLLFGLEEKKCARCWWARWVGSICVQKRMRDLAGPGGGEDGGVVTRYAT